jgi:hypothetical protein
VGVIALTEILKIYIVTDGIYSDYKICGVYTTKELAQKFVDIYGGEIEQWEVDDDEVIKNKYNLYKITMDISGNTKEINISNDWYDYLRINKYDNDITHVRFEEDLTHLDIFVLAKDEQSAIKIANEKRIKYISEI